MFISFLFIYLAFLFEFWKKEHSFSPTLIITAGFGWQEVIYQKVEKSSFSFFFLIRAPHIFRQNKNENPLIHTDTHTHRI